MIIIIIKQECFICVICKLAEVVVVCIYPSQGMRSTCCTCIYSNNASYVHCCRVEQVPPAPCKCVSNPCRLTYLLPLLSFIFLARFSLAARLDLSICGWLSRYASIHLILFSSVIFSSAQKKKGHCFLSRHAEQAKNRLGSFFSKNRSNSKVGPAACTPAAIQATEFSRY